MPRMIDGDELLTDLGITHAVKYGNTSPEQRHMSYSSFLAYEVADAIRDAPTIDQERHGYWIQHRGGDGEYDECSRCGYEAGLGFAYSLDYKYCPECGAKMDLEVPHEQ